MANDARKPERTDEQAKEFALFDAARDPKEFLPEIYREASNAAQDPDAGTVSVCESRSLLQHSDCPGRKTKLGHYLVFASLVFSSGIWHAGAPK
jgi:hypothetical protein